MGPGHRGGRLERLPRLLRPSPGVHAEGIRDVRRCLRTAIGTVPGGDGERSVAAASRARHGIDGRVQRRVDAENGDGRGQEHHEEAVSDRRFDDFFDHESVSP